MRGGGTGTTPGSEPKRGVADAVRPLYHERAALRYDGLSRQLRMADIIELTHPAPTGDRQSALFRYLLDRRHHDDAIADAGILAVLAAAAALEAVPRRPASVAAAASAVRPRSAPAGFSWERLSGWLPGGMDAEAWEAVIPSMGVMALVRNLRNFDQAAISEAAIEAVIANITDPAEVARARLFPYQVWAAYKNAPSDNWKRALGATLDLTVDNVPALDGTLVVVDTSGSMRMAVSRRSTMQRVEVAAVMAMATAKARHQRRGGDLRSGQRPGPRSRRRLGARRRGHGGALGRLCRPRHLRPHRHRPLVQPARVSLGPDHRRSTCSPTRSILRPRLDSRSPHKPVRSCPQTATGNHLKPPARRRVLVVLRTDRDAADGC